MAKAARLFERLESADQDAGDAAIASLRKLEVQCALPPESPGVEIAPSDAEAVVEQAQSLLVKLQVGVPLATASLEQLT